MLTDLEGNFIWLRKWYVYQNEAALFAVILLGSLPPLLLAGEAGYAERRKTQREVRIVDGPAVIAGGWGGREFGAK